TFLAVACTIAGAIGSQQVAVAKNTLDTMRAQFQYSARDATDGTNVTLPARSVISDAATSSLSTDSSGKLVPVDSIDAHVGLAAAADGSTTIATTDGAMRLDFALHGAKNVSAVASGGYAVHTNADVHGGHYVEAIVHDGVENYVSFNSSPGSD